VPGIDLNTFKWILFYNQQSLSRMIATNRRTGMSIDLGLIAPCGMNCGICMAYLRKKRHCPGCNDYDSNKTEGRLRCQIKNCLEIQQSKSGFCYECVHIPCARLKHLDKRYRTKYGMSMLENLEFIRFNGLPAFIKKEKTRWQCAECGRTICVHKHLCSSCETPFAIEKTGQTKEEPL
jgi:hypothetical protein